MSEPSPLAAAAVYRAVQLIEDDGPLDDAQPLRQLRSGDDRSRLIERAWLLGERLGLVREWARWRRLGGGVVLGLALLVALGAWLLAKSIVGEDRQINAIAAFFSLLGLHALTWLLWSAGLLVRWPAAGGALGRLALQLTARLPLERGPHAVQLARATADVLTRARLSAWAFGGISHLVWALSFAVLLLGLALGFSVRAYQLGWETTLLSPGFFAQFVQLTGSLPALLGFPVPDAASPGQPQAWAWWLIGCVLVYGLLLRLLSAALCLLVWRRAQARLAPDLAEPYARRLLARFAALAPVEVLDRENAAAPAARPRPGAIDPARRVLLGFELPPEADWPAQRLAGSQAEREAFLQDLAARPPARLLLVVHAPSSPDRGTARFLHEAAAGEVAVLATGGDAGRWREWLADRQLQAFNDRAAALAWLEQQGAP